MKVLLITHNPTVSNNNMGKTFLSLFSEFKNYELCQLYVHPAIPDTNVCQSYYQITDRQVLRSLPFGTPGGKVSPSKIEEQIQKLKNQTAPPPQPRKKSGALQHLVRDAVWGMSRWYSKELQQWLETEKPTCIFLAPGYAGFIYNVALQISKKINIPIVTYICDDYYFVEGKKDFLSRWHLKRLRKKTNLLMENTGSLVVISDEMKQIYQKNFSVPTEVIMTGATFPLFSQKSNKQLLNFSYFGNLSVGRHRSLLNIAIALDEINSLYGTNAKLHVYTVERSTERIEELSKFNSVKFHDFVSGKEFEKAYAESDILIHTESFEQVDIDVVKHSISTKIADALASGIPLLAYGPCSISSIQHLLRNESALIATSFDELKDILVKIILHSETVSNVVSQALKTAEIHHNKEKNSRKLYQILAEAGKTSDE